MGSAVEISPAECRELLATRTIGVIAYTEHAQPAIRTVEYVVDGEEVLVRTTADSIFARAVANATVALNVHVVDVDRRSGWSVTAVGRARLLPLEESQRLASRLGTWAPEGQSQVLHLRLQKLTGRRMRAGAVVPAEQTGPALGALAV
ncbi:pyridoxamine 5'-phosphate oxidase family protein [Kineococcus glutinatus]|uniref:Pyridoxamine 5'-phosphate oxidase family protein n=1 Tax=Kineococcus glutinatus TaxID=1070872 RepID=A0ABP8VEJ6_9ACTN